MMNPAPYKKIIDQSAIGYAYTKIVTDEGGVPCDIIYIEVNQAFEEITGMMGEKIIGKLITSVVPRIAKDEFDWIGFLGDVALNGKRKSFTQYSKTLKRWCNGEAFSLEPGYVAVNIIDVTKDQIQIQGLKKISKTSEAFLQGLGGEIPYQQLTNTLLELSEAKYAAFNLYDENGKKFKTVAVAGDREKIRKTMEIMGMQLEGKEWDYDPWRAEKIKDQTVTRFASLYELTGEVIPKTVCDLLTKTFGIGETVVVKISKQNAVLGDFTFMMPKGQSFRNDVIVEMFGRQLGMMVDRGRMEEALKVINDNQETLLEISTLLMGATFETLDAIIEETLEKAAKIALADRAYVFEYDFEKQVCNNTYEWCREGIIPQIHDLQGIPLEAAGDWLKEHQEKRTVVINDVQSLTEGDPIKSMLETQGVRSVIAVPLFLGKTLYGFIGFDAVKTLHYYTTKEKTLLLQYGNALLSTLSRINANRALQEQKERIEYLSFHDHLTGLYNRRYFEAELKRLDTKRNLPIAVIMGDVNGLKLINDTFGHEAGDKLLMKSAQTIREACREDEIIARTGGDEFTLLLPNTHGNEAERIIDRIQQSLKNTRIKGMEASISFGYETKTSMTQDMAFVLKKAENIMYEKKLVDGLNMRGKAIESIINSLHERSPGEKIHGKRVSELCVTIGEALGMKKDEVDELKTLGLLHDIGKSAISDKILNKPEKLTGEEYSEIRRHPEIGYRILIITTEFSEIAHYVLAHHERWDGKGYPKGLAGKVIPLQSRICSIANAYDVMTRDQPYQSALSDQEAVRELKKNAGTQFDPELVEVLLRDGRGVDKVDRGTE